MNYYLGIDLGGTTIKTGVVDENFKIRGKSSCHTELPKTPGEIALLMKESADGACKDAGIEMGMVSWAGIGVPGTVNPLKGIITFASNFGFTNVPMAQIVEEKLNKPIYLENDANCAIYGEMLNGSAKGCRNVVLLTLGTGVGGGVIVDGRIYSGFNNHGAELGHVGIVFEGEQCPCGNKGCIEMYCSATALNKQIKDAMILDKDSYLWQLSGNDIHNANGILLFDAAEKGDETAKNVLKKYTSYLGFAVTNYINIFQPEMIVIGGGISQQGSRLINPLKEYASQYALGYMPNSHTEIAAAALGNDAGIIGAAFLGKLYNNESIKEEAV